MHTQHDRCLCFTLGHEPLSSARYKMAHGLIWPRAASKRFDLCVYAVSALFECAR